TRHPSYALNNLEVSHDQCVIQSQNAEAAMKRNYRASLVITALLIILPVRATHARCVYQPRLVAVDTPVIIPFDLVTRHIMVKIKVNNSRPLSFVLDTGDKVGVIDIDVAKELGLKLEGQVHVGGAGAETLPGSMVKEASWTLPGLDGFSQPVTLAIPLGRM